MYYTNMDPRTQQNRPDAELRLWTAIEAIHRDIAADRLKLGKLFLQLRFLYSERSAGVRLSSGPGTFEYEIKKRGFRPNRVREWITDYEVSAGLRSTDDSTSHKRAARRRRTTTSAEYQRGFNDGCLRTKGSEQDSHWAAFAK